MVPIERPLNSATPSGPVQVSPPSVDLYRPTPAAESPDAFASPVPAYRVLPVASLGSISSELPDWMPKPADRNFQRGVSPRALSVRHTPPLAAKIHRRQLPGAQFGSMASAVVRPPATYSLGT